METSVVVEGEELELGLLVSGTGGSAEMLAAVSRSLSSPVGSSSFKGCDEPGSGLSMLAINAPATTPRCCFCVTRESGKTENETC